MKATHRDGRTFEGDESEFYRTFQPAGFQRVDEPKPAEAEEPETAEADDEPKPKNGKKA